MMIRFAALAMLALSTPAFAAQPITGNWLTTDGSAIIAIGNCGSSLCGRITRILKRTTSGPAVDAKNPNATLRGRSLVGVAVLTGLTASGDGWSGQVYDPKTGKSYRATVTRDGGKLNVKGCLGPFCRTSVWTAAS